MRRQELQNQDPALFREVAGCEVGHLGLVTTGRVPRVVPLNFAAVGETIYFHGALDGEKWELLKDGAAVSFLMTVPYSLIPSHWTECEPASSGLSTSVLIFRPSRSYTAILTWPRIGTANLIEVVGLNGLG